jgi:hypothetical protein
MLQTQFFGFMIQIALVIFLLPIPYKYISLKAYTLLKEGSHCPDHFKFRNASKRGFLGKGSPASVMETPFGGVPPGNRVSK